MHAMARLTECEVGGWLTLEQRRIFRTLRLSVIEAIIPPQVNWLSHYRPFEFEKPAGEIVGWWHFHPGGGVAPSGTDTDQIEKLTERWKCPLVTIIMARNGAISARLDLNLSGIPLTFEVNTELTEVVTPAVMETVRKYTEIYDVLHEVDNDYSTDRSFDFELLKYQAKKEGEIGDAARAALAARSERTANAREHSRGKNRKFFGE